MTNITFYWESIECIERNGDITGYAVRFQGDDIVPGLVVNRTFNVSGLTPGTRYTFQVAGININGTGPYTDAVYVTTDEDGMVLVMHGVSMS